MKKPLLAARREYICIRLARQPWKMRSIVSAVDSGDIASSKASRLWKMDGNQIFTAFSNVVCDHHASSGVSRKGKGLPAAVLVVVVSGAGEGAAEVSAELVVSERLPCLPQPTTLCA